MGLNITKYKNGTKVKVTVPDLTETGEKIKYNLFGIITYTFPMGYNNALAGLYITDYCDCQERFIGDIFNIYETEVITALED